MAVFQSMHLVSDLLQSGMCIIQKFLMCLNSDMGASQLMGFCGLGLGLFLANQLPRSNCGSDLAYASGVSAHGTGDCSTAIGSKLPPTVFDVFEQ